MAAEVTVYAYGNSDALHGIFNAIAMIMGGDDFGAMVNIALIIGFLTVGVLAMAPNGIGKSWNWFITVAVLNGILLVPKADVVIEDRLGLKPAVAVGNVPWTIALLGSVKSSIGSSLTELFETSFQTIPSADKALPSELAYLNTGVMFGNRLIKGSREAAVHDPNGNADLLSYMRSCVFPEYEYGGNAAATQKSIKLVDLMADPNPALIVAVHDGDGNLDTMGCDLAWQLLGPRLMDAGGWADQAFRQLAAKSFPDRAIGDAMTATESSLVAAYGKAKLADATAQARDIMIQNIMINATADAAALHSASLDDPAMLTLAAARSQAISQMNAGFLTQGRIAEEALPLIRNVVEGIIYALFPIICLVAIASEGQALKTTIKGYLLVMLWVELWPPMFAIVNYLQTLASSANMGAAGVMTGAQGLSLETAGAVFGTAVSDLAVASWMVTFVPVIAGAALFGMNQLMSSMGGAKPGAAAADAAAGQATKGNLSMGQFSTLNQPADVVANPFMRIQIGVGGSSTGDVRGGPRIDNYAESSTLVGLSDQAGWQRQASEARSDALRQSRTDSQGWVRSIDAGFNELLSLTKAGSKGVERSTALEVGRVASEEQMRSDIASSAQSISKKFGISDTSAVTKAIEATAGGSAGISVPGFAELRAGLVASGRSQEAEQITRDVTRAGEEARRQQTQRKEAVVDNFKRSDGFSSLKGQRNEAVDRIDASLSEGIGHREQAAIALEQARAHELAERKIAAFGIQGVARWGNEIANFFRAHGQDPMKGIARTEEQKGLLRQFILQGDLAGDGGSWMPDMGQGPNMPRQGLDFGRDGLRETYAWDPMTTSGPAAVREFGAAERQKMQAAGAALGVSPTQAVGPGTLPGQVDAAQARTRAAVAASEAQLAEQRGDASVAVQGRAATTSDQHSTPQLRGYNTANPIQNDARFGQQAQPAFPAENAEAKARAEERAVALKRGVTQIPMGPAAPAPTADKRNQ